MTEINDRLPYPYHVVGSTAHGCPTRRLGCDPTGQASREEPNRPEYSNENKTVIRSNYTGRWVPGTYGAGLFCI